MRVATKILEKFRNHCHCRVRECFFLDRERNQTQRNRQRFQRSFQSQHTDDCSKPKMLLLRFYTNLSLLHHSLTSPSTPSTTSLSAQLTSNMPSSEIKPAKEGIDFESLPWNLNHPEEHSYVHLTTTTGEWSKDHYDAATDSGSIFDSIKKYDETNLPLSPACCSLNYGTTIWEGLKCYRDKDGNAVVFRPDRNFHRFSNGALQMSLPQPSFELFMRGIQVALQENSHIIPPHGEGMKLYVRPMLLGSGQQLGLHPPSEVSLLFYVSPTVSI